MLHPISVTDGCDDEVEHAIKRFAYYREITDGYLTENTLADHLVLLSIYQTCEYKGINFLKFLLSGEIDIWKYRERKRQMPKPVNGKGVSLLEQAFFDKKLRPKKSVLQGGVPVVSPE